MQLFDQGIVISVLAVTVFWGGGVSVSLQLRYCSHFSEPLQGIVGRGGIVISVLVVKVIYAVILPRYRISVLAVKVLLSVSL